MADRELLRRIRKCLALSTSANEHEAAAALAKARELMASNGLTDADLASLHIEEATARGAGTQQPAQWQRYLVATVRRALNVHAFLDEDLRWRFVGHGPSAEIAAYAFTSLFRRLKAARSEYQRKTLRRCTLARRRVRADAYCEGWATAVFGKVAALAPKLPCDPAIDRYLTAHHPGLIPVARRKEGRDAARTSNDAWRGYDAGRAVELNQGVGGTSPPPQMIEMVR